MTTTTFRYGVTFGLGIAAANLLLQFALGRLLPWQVIGALSIAAWVIGVAAAGVFATRTERLRAGAAAAVIAAAVDLTRGIAVDFIAGVPVSSAGHAITPGMAAGASVVEFVFIAPFAAGVGLVAARLFAKPLSSSAVVGD